PTCHFLSPLVVFCPGLPTAEHRIHCVPRVLLGGTRRFGFVPISVGYVVSVTRRRLPKATAKERILTADQNFSARILSRTTPSAGSTCNVRTLALTVPALMRAYASDKRWIAADD